MVIIRATDPGKAADVSHSCYVPDSGFGTALFDAKNGFNKVNQYLMIWTAAHRWTKARRSAFNRYRHQNIVYVRDRPGKPSIQGGHRPGMQPLHEPTELHSCPFSRGCKQQSLIP